MGKHVAKIIRAEVEDKVPVSARTPFNYVDKGTMATNGKRRAVADINGFRFGGFFAWAMWSLVHIMYLIGFRTKLFVMMGWIYDYVFNNREARLITGNFKPRVRKLPGLRPVQPVEGAPV
jgi:NADH dehydrogenase